MARNFKELTAHFTPERKARIARKTEELLEQIALADLRKERCMTQADMAEAMQVGQGTVSKIEQRGTTNLNTLDNFVRGLGGRLVLRAEFPDKTVELAIAE